LSPFQWWKSRCCSVVQIVATHFPWIFRSFPWKYKVTYQTRCVTIHHVLIFLFHWL
jgi:hypothetical protein